MKRNLASKRKATTTKQSSKLIISGKNSIAEAIDAGVSISKIWLLEDSKRDPKLLDILKKAREKKIPIVQANKRKLYELSDNSNQIKSIIAELSPIELKEEKFLLGNDLKRIIIPVEVEDPHNLGAIIRSAYAFGVDALALSNRRSAQLNETIVKSSSGAAFHLPVARIGNIAQCLEKLKEKGFWIYGSYCLDEGSEEELAKLKKDKSEIKSLWETKFDSKTVLLMGNEGKGLGPNLLKHCDFLVNIPIKFNSLNVSVATGVILSKIYQDQND